MLDYSPISQCLEKNPWEFGWDGLVAIGTIGLAVAAALPIFSDWRRRRDDASRIAILIDGELHSLSGILTALAENTTDQFRTPATYKNAVQAIYHAHPLVGVPLLDRFVDRLGVFNTRLGMDISAMLISATQYTRAKPPEEFREADVPYERALRSIVIAHEQAVLLVVRAWKIRRAIQPEIARVVRLPEAPEPPQWLMTIYNDIMTTARVPPDTTPQA